MAERPPRPELVGRARVLAQLRASLDAAGDGHRSTVLVSGSAGVGKTALARAAAAESGRVVGWGTCVADAPGYWPWTQLLSGLVHSVGISPARELAGDDAPLLASIVPSLGEPAVGEASARTRLLLMDATSRFLDGLATVQPLVVVLDDLQWADESSLVLLDVVARAPGSSGVGVVGAYRHDELTPAARTRLAALASHGRHVQLAGLDVAEVRELVGLVRGGPVDLALAEQIHQRTGGHPFFTRELALAGSEPGAVPGAVQEVLLGTVARLPGPTRTVLDVAAVAGTPVPVDVIARALGVSAVDVEGAARPAIDGGILAPGEPGLGFAHDLWRESLVAALAPAKRIELHQAIGAALEDRTVRTQQGAPSELARHFVAAIALDGPGRAVHWTLEAAAADGAALAFAEAAGKLHRLRGAIADAGVRFAEDRLVDVLLAEADALARGGGGHEARDRLRSAREVAVRIGDAARTARVALAVAHLGAAFSARRDESVAELREALAVVSAAGGEPLLEAQLTATLARELQHSVADDRPDAGPLSERALQLSRSANDPATLIGALFARHDVLWTPGTAPERATIAEEIVRVARSTADLGRQAEGLLLLATSRLEQGSAAYREPLEECLALLDGLGQPRHRYVAETRRAFGLLLRGELTDAEQAIERAAATGEHIREPDTANVRMSQRLELVRARGEAEELRAFAREAVEHWTGAPVHAHAVAAGFLARAGDLDLAATHVAAVHDLGTWRADRSYLRSVFLRELAQAAAALQDLPLCEELLDELSPLAAACGVNGAVVAFAGSHAHTLGHLAAALGRPDAARDHLEQAAKVYLRIGAEGWFAEVRPHPAPPPSTGPSEASLRRDGNVWHITYAGQAATVLHVKGLGDLARLLAAPGEEIHVLDLADGSDRRGGSDAVVDRQALAEYRTRLRELDDDIDEAAGHHDSERHARLVAERDDLVDELGRVTGLGGRSRSFANHPAERARKAVSARLRDAIRRLEPALPALAAHLEERIVTGTYCRYRAVDAPVWTVATDAPPTPRRR